MYLRGIVMNLEIRSLDKNNPEELPNFFDSLDYSHAPHWSGCYCRFYHVDDSQGEWTQRDAQLNRKETIESIRNEEMEGFIAYDNDKAVAWLNAQPTHRFKRLEPVFSQYNFDKYIVSICFVVHPDYRNKGLATQLLSHAISVFKSQGYMGMLALPPKEVYDIQKSYRGTLSMYLKHGYEVIEERDGTCLVKLDF